MQRHVLPCLDVHPLLTLLCWQIDLLESAVCKLNPSVAFCHGDQHFANMIYDSEKGS